MTSTQFPYKRLTDEEPQATATHDLKQQSVAQPPTGFQPRTYQSLDPVAETAHVHADGKVGLSQHVILDDEVEIGLKLEDVVRPSQFAINPQAQRNQFKLDEKKLDKKIESMTLEEQQIRAIVAEFNRGITESSIVTSAVRGERIKQDELLLVERNGRPEIAMPSQSNLALPFVTGPGVNVSRLGAFKRNSLIIGSNGHYILNVPPGKYALAYSNNKPVIYGEGLHVIHDATFVFNNQCVDKNQEHIQHGEGNYQIHILQMQRNKIAKIYDGKEQIAKILPHRDQAYVFQDPYFKLETPLLQGDAKHAESFFQITDNYISHANLHKLRVPIGSIAKVLLGPNETPEILVAGEYEFDDAFFKIVGADNKVVDKNETNPKKLFFDAQNDYISHRTKHIIRNKPGEIALVLNRNNPEFLLSPASLMPEVDAKVSPFSNYTKPKQGAVLSVHMKAVYEAYTDAHIIDDALFDVIQPAARNLPATSSHADEKHAALPKKQFVSETEAYICHGNKHILRIPPGKYVKAWMGSEAVILTHTAKPFYSSDPTFRVENASPKSFFGDMNEAYIHHGNLHRLRVPAGKIAKVWNGTSAQLVSSQEAVNFGEPVNALPSGVPPLPKDFFYHPNFELQRDTADGLFADAAKDVIQFGGLTRIVPSSSKVAVLNMKGKDGLPIIVRPIGEDGKAHVVSNPAVSVRCWLPTTAKPFIFPTKEMIDRKIRDEKIPASEAQFEVFRTSDSRRVGVKLFVQVQIQEQDAAIAAGFFEDIETVWTHVEDTTQTDMTKAIGSVKYEKILNGDLARPPHHDVEDEKDKTKPSAPRRYIQDEILEDLTRDLKKKGLTLTNFAILEYEPLDKAALDQMQQASAGAAKLSAEVANLEANKTISIKQAELEAEKKQVAARQKNESLIREKETELKVAQAEAEATRAKAQASADAFKFDADAKQHAVYIQAKSQQDLAILKAESDQKIGLLKAENESKAILMRAEAEQKAFLLKAKGEQEAARLAIDNEKLKLANMQTSVMLNVNARVAEITGIANAYAASKPYADSETAKATAPVLAAALSKSNFQVMAGMNPQELMMMMLAMQSGMMPQSMAQAAANVVMPTTASPGMMTQLNPFAFFTPARAAQQATQHSSAATAASVTDYKTDQPRLLTDAPHASLFQSGAQASAPQGVALETAALNSGGQAAPLKQIANA